MDASVMTAVAVEPSGSPAGVKRKRIDEASASSAERDRERASVIKAAADDGYGQDTKDRMYVELNKSRWNSGGDLQSKDLLENKPRRPCELPLDCSDYDGKHEIINIAHTSERLGESDLEKNTFQAPLDIGKQPTLEHELGSFGSQALLTLDNTPVLSPHTVSCRAQTHENSAHPSPRALPKRADPR